MNNCDINPAKEEVEERVTQQREDGAEDDDDPTTPRRRRLSRKEHKERRRKKQKAAPSAPPPETGQNSNNNNSDDDTTQTKGAEQKPTRGTSTKIESCEKNGDTFQEEEDDDAFYRESYVPTQFSTPKNKEEKDANVNNNNTNTAINPGFVEPKSLGKWFPKAVTLKRPRTIAAAAASSSTTTATAAILLFYQYKSPPWTDSQLSAVTRALVQIGHARPCLAGRLRVAHEGINATLSAMDDDDDDNNNNTEDATRTKRITALQTLHHFAMDLQRLDAATFCRTDFKYICNLTLDRHFASLCILPVQELVYYGGLNDQSAPLSSGGQHVSPHEFHALLAGQQKHHRMGIVHQPPSATQPNPTHPSSNSKTDPENTNATSPPSGPKETVVIDVRNHYEAALGRFDGQEKQQQEQSTDASASEAAKYVDPLMRKSTDFPAWVQANKDNLVGKRVLLYCTGGIRCERASAHLSTVLRTCNSNSSSTKNDLSVGTIPETEIYQLQGGIERYLQAFPDGGFWRGKNFTFDKREAIGVDNWNGDGGVVVRKAKQKENKTIAPLLPECVCTVCQQPWDRYVGKKKCSTCGVPVLVCDTCLTQRKSGRCPLCVEQNVTVRVEEVEYTKNGVETKVPVKNKTVTNNNYPDEESGKVAMAAPTVLKWGGGHAADKKVKRQWKRMPCRFGSNCNRTDCFFQHP